MSATALASKLRRAMRNGTSFHVSAEEVRFLFDGGFLRPLGIGEPLAEPRELPWPAYEVVYFVGAQNENAPIKIGYASNLRARFKALKYMSPEPLKVLAYTPGSLQDEAAYHNQFADLRLHGEWFARKEPLLSFVTDLQMEIMSR